MESFLSMKYELELNKMIKIFGDYYKFIILKQALSEIKNNLVKKYLLKLMEAYNNAIEIIIKYMPNEEGKEQWIQDYFFEFYMNMLQNKLIEFQMLLEIKKGLKGYNIDIFELYKKKYVKKLKQDILEYWNEQKIDNNLIGDRDFIKMFDEIHDYALIKYKDIFMRRLKQIKYLYRAARGNHFDNYERMIPKSEYCKNNRWNPDGVEFLYLGCDYKRSNQNFINSPKKTCCEEIRLKKSEDVTLCRFKWTNANSKLLNLYIDEEFVEKEKENLDFLYNKEIEKFKNDNKAISVFSKLSNQGKVDDAKEYIKLKTTSNVDKKYVERYVSTLLISDIVDAIFKPVDESEDPQLESYIPFRLFATYLIDKGYDGIIYRSTRMDMLGQEGKNVVLFNKNDATYWENSMEVYHYGDEGYIKVCP